MALRCNLGEVPVFGGELRMLARGNFTASGELAGKLLPAGPVTLVIYTEKQVATTFAGVIRFADVKLGSETVTFDLVGGKGGLVRSLPFRDTISGAAPVQAGILARAIADDCGETLAPGVEASLDALTLPRWTRAAGPEMVGTYALELLCAALSTDATPISWRMQVDGLLWIGTDLWPDGPAGVTQTDPDIADGSLVFAPDGAPILPGTTLVSLNGARLRAVEVDYLMAGAALRCSVRGALPSDPPRFLAPRVYREIHRCEVKAQRDDGTLDLQPTDVRLGAGDPGSLGLLGVALRTAIPGELLTVPAGTIVRVAFEGGSPAGVFAFGVDQDPAADRALSLVGDGVTIGYLSGTCAAAPGPVVLSFSPTPTGAPGEVQITGSIAGPGHRYAKGVRGP